MKDKMIITIEVYGVLSIISLSEEADFNEVMTAFKGQLISLGYSHQTVFNDDDEDL
jgi:hypothetical protein